MGMLFNVAGLMESFHRQPCDKAVGVDREEARGELGGSVSATAQIGLSAQAGAARIHSQSQWWQASLGYTKL
jgi:hypothetical protein